MTRTPAKHPQSGPNVPEVGSQSLTLEEEIDRKVGDLVPQGSRNEVVARITSLMVSEYFSGPIAHPRHLREYENICPGSADRIIRMAEDRNGHIMKMEAKVADAEIADQKRGMWFGVLLFASLIGAALVTALSELGSLTTGIFLGTVVIGGISIFVKGRNGTK